LAGPALAKTEIDDVWVPVKEASASQCAVILEPGFPVAFWAGAKV
jgi:hypothetical protein